MVVAGVTIAILSWSAPPSSRCSSPSARPPWPTDTLACHLGDPETATLRAKDFEHLLDAHLHPLADAALLTAQGTIRLAGGDLEGAADAWEQSVLGGLPDARSVARDVLCDADVDAAWTRGRAMELSRR